MPGAPTPEEGTDPLAALPWPLRGERIEIRPVTAADAEAVWRYRRIPEVQEWISTAPTSFGSFRPYFVEPSRMAVEFAIVLEEPDGPRVIGDIMLKIEDAWAQTEVQEAGRAVQAELGWSLDPAYGGRGYATEAVRLTIDLCFGRLDLRRVHAGCFADNEPSWRLMERIGMRREEHSRGTALHRSGRWLDGMNYALLASEWKVGAPEGSGFRIAAES